MGERGGSRFSEFDRRRIVAESYLPDVSVGSVARRHGVSAKQIFSWRRRYRTENLSGRFPEGFSEGFPGNLGGGFVPVEVVGEDVRDEVPTVRDGDDFGKSSSDGVEGTLTIDLPDGVQVRITGAVALPMLSCVLKQLRGAA